MIISPQHRVLITDGRNEVLGPAKGLLAHKGVRLRKGQRKIGYHALLFSTHEIIFAEGCRVESLYPGPQAMRLRTRAQRMCGFPHISCGHGR